MKLTNYCILSVLVFLIGLYGFYAGINHPAGDKPPVMHQEMGHSMPHNSGEK